jgi:outer membrane lipoprotein SlyB
MFAEIVIIQKVGGMFRVLFTLFVSVVVAYIFLMSLSGCKPRQTSSETTTEVRSTDSDRARYGTIVEEPRVIERSTTTTVERDETAEGGLFSIVGDIIALPFRAVGGLLSAIF